MILCVNFDLNWIHFCHGSKPPPPPPPPPPLFPPSFFPVILFFFFLFLKCLYYNWVMSCTKSYQTLGKRITSSWTNAWLYWFGFIYIKAKQLLSNTLHPFILWVIGKEMIFLFFLFFFLCFLLRETGTGPCAIWNYLELLNKCSFQYLYQHSSFVCVCVCVMKGGCNCTWLNVRYRLLWLKLHTHTHTHCMYTHTHTHKFTYPSLALNHLWGVQVYSDTKINNMASIILKYLSL